MKPTFYIFLFYLSLLFISSCDNWGLSCGKNEKFDTKFHATELSTKINAYYYNEFDTSKNRFNTVNIYLRFNGPTYSLNPKINNSWIQSAYACSPPDPKSEEKITKIEVSCIYDYNENYPAGVLINDIIEIEQPSFGKSSIAEFLSKSPNIGDAKMTLTEAPDSSQNYKFVIKYEFEGKLTKSLIDTTDQIFILHQ